MVALFLPSKKKTCPENLVQAEKKKTLALPEEKNSDQVKEGKPPLRISNGPPLTICLVQIRI